MGSTSNSQNYFGLSIVNSIYSGTPDGTMGLTVQEAYAIDIKIDDGLPQSGRITATYLDRYSGATDMSTWAGVAAMYGNPFSTATTGSSTTCFDNSTDSAGQVAANGNLQHYSLEMSQGAGVNCALSFKFQ